MEIRQTDRQTQSTRKSTWWSITTFDQMEIDQLSSSSYPDFVAKVYGGLEKCPKTEKIHFQGAVHCRYQIRFSGLKKWLPKSHIEPANNIEALKKYAMKEATAVEPKVERTNHTRYYKPHEILDLLAEKFVEVRDSLEVDGIEDFYYVKLMSLILKDDRTIINFVDNKLRKNWIDFHNQFIAHAFANSITQKQGE